MAKFNVIDQSNANFAAIQKTLAEAATRFDYNELTRAFNALAVGAILAFDFQKAKVAMLAKQLEKRGLKRDEDYTVVGAQNGENGPEVAYVTRLTEKAGNIVTAGPRGPRKKAEGDASTPKAPKNPKAPKADAAK